MFRKILIANRGEIACRVIRTARRMGIGTVAVYSDADAGALHVAMADEAYRIGPAAIAGAKREGLSSFGDDRLLIERYLQRPRHIEIQVFADSHGQVIHLFERDCSIQRRHQKIIEEAPAPGMLPAMRDAMGRAAVAAARAVGYVGAGTVEFIVENDAFHFMEMNTRLQVEHPVTEAITGLDLVEWQIRVAAGEALPRGQAEVAIAGHAIEVRLYAEDPARDFLPSVGRIAHLRLPEGARVECGVRAGDTITPDYDPMIAKVIVHGPDRGTALARLRAALAACEVVGVQTNLALLGAIAGHAGFAGGAFDTGFIGRTPEVLEGAAEVPAEAMAAAALHVLGRRAMTPGAEPWSPWSDTDAFRLNLRGVRSVRLDGAEVLAARSGEGWALTWDGATREGRLEDGLLRLDGRIVPVTVVEAGERITVLIAGRPHHFALVDPLAPPSAAAPGADHVLAPIPGRITAVLCAPGDVVGKGQALIVLEAMKMEMTLTAAMDGTIAAVRCAVGDMVQERADLVDFVAEASA